MRIEKCLILSRLKRGPKLVFLLLTGSSGSAVSDAGGWLGDQVFKYISRLETLLSEVFKSTCGSHEVLKCVLKTQVKKGA